jgi:hypothetical protein
VTVERDGADGRSEQSGENAQQRRLPRSIRSDDRDDLARAE